MPQKKPGVVAWQGEKGAIKVTPVMMVVELDKQSSNMPAHILVHLFFQVTHIPAMIVKYYSSRFITAVPATGKYSVPEL
jgi:hypothetical protein